jgi:hypothetical protein
MASEESCIKGASTVRRRNLDAHKAVEKFAEIGRGLAI